AVAGLTLLLAGCGGGSQPAGSAPPAAPASAPAETGTLTVLAAASLTETFTGMVKSLEAATQVAHVRLNDARSYAPAAQLVIGADRVVHRVGEAFLCRTSWRRRQAELRRGVGPRAADRQRRACRRLRRGERRHHEDGHRRGDGRRHPDRLRDERPADRDRAGQ